MSALTEERLFSTAEVAERFGVSLETVQRWAALGNIASIRVGRQGRYRFRASEIQRLLSNERDEDAA